MKKKTIILGIDPGFKITGLSIIELNKLNKILILYKKEIKFKIKNNYMIKMNYIYNKIKKIIKKYNPNILIMESSFLGKNVNSLRRLIQCQSSIILAAKYYNKKIIEYSPKTIKYLITGYGNSTKKELKIKIEKILNINLNYNNKYDISDSLGIALSYLYKKKILKLK